VLDTYDRGSDEYVLGPRTVYYTFGSLQKGIAGKSGGKRGERALGYSEKGWVSTEIYLWSLER